MARMRQGKYLAEKIEMRFLFLLLLGYGLYKILSWLYTYFVKANDENGPRGRKNDSDEKRDWGGKYVDFKEIKDDDNKS